MKNLLAYSLLILSSGAIVASAVSILQQAHFMIWHLIGSVILLAFVFSTRPFDQNEKTEWRNTQKTLFALTWIYIVFLIISVIGSITVTFYFHAWRKLGKGVFGVIFIVALYTTCSILYSIKAKKNRNKEV